MELRPEIRFSSHGLWSPNYSTNPLGDIDRPVVLLDEAEVTFVRRAVTSLSDHKTLHTYAGEYETALSVGEYELERKKGL